MRCPYRTVPKPVTIQRTPDGVGMWRKNCSCSERRPFLFTPLYVLTTSPASCWWRTKTACEQFKEKKITTSKCENTKPSPLWRRCFCSLHSFAALAKRLDFDLPVCLLIRLPRVATHAHIHVHRLLYDYLPNSLTTTACLIIAYLVSIICARWLSVDFRVIRMSRFTVYILCALVVNWWKQAWLAVRPAK